MSIETTAPLTEGSPFADRWAAAQRSAAEVEVTAATHSLPTGRVEARWDAVRIFTTDMDDLYAWLGTLGGEVTSVPAGRGVQLWTVETRTDPGAGGARVTVLVQCLALDDEPVVDAMRAAVAA